MYKELFSLNALQPWADELNLRVEPQLHKGNLQRVLVFGPGVATGQFFRKIGDYFDDFKRRYYSHPLSAEVACLFVPNRVGDIRRAELQKRYDSERLT